MNQKISPLDPRVVIHGRTVRQIPLPLFWTASGVELETNARMLAFCTGCQLYYPRAVGACGGGRRDCTAPAARPRTKYPDRVARHDFGQLAARAAV